MAPGAIPGCGLCGRSESHPAILTAPALHRAPIAWAVLLPSRPITAIRLRNVFLVLAGNPAQEVWR